MTKAHPNLRAKAARLIGYMEKLDHPIFITESWRSYARHRALYAQGREVPGAIVTNAAPGTSKHEHMEDGQPCALAVDVAFEVGGQRGPQSPWDESHPWGVLRMVAVELCGLKAISKWNGNQFTGDRPHYELME